MEWLEFTTLLSGLMPQTPLGMIVQIRSEEDRDMLKYFTPEQHSIRNAWRSRHSVIEDMTDEEEEDSVKKLQDIIAEAFR